MTAPAPTNPLRVTLKLATSLDGRIATRSGESKWITGEAARAETHRLRALHGAIIVGSGTALADGPELTARTDPPPARQPLRIIADGRGRLPASARIFSTLDRGPVAIATQETTDLDACAWPARRGVEYWMLAPGPDGRGVDVRELVERVSGAGATSLMVEGGGELAASFLSAGLVDCIEWFRAPILLGGDARPCLGGLGLEMLADAPTFTRTEVRALGPDLWERYQRCSEAGGT
jgi:diaminohydroxyphosphoribosylaminopyrimidine deaminase / 5-amino-6-(5-phosphoribosylamino)uracil reductase